VNVGHNYLENKISLNKIPIENLKYLFSEIFYGGHITEKFDRRLCKAYIEEFVDMKMVLFFA
jgi:dynein heavy chain, axonemal